MLWIDADAAVVDLSLDIADQLRRRDLMAMTAHCTPEGIDPIPNCGVWLLRAEPAIDKLLADVWASTTRLHHKWWENAAVLDQLGHELDPQVRLAAPTRLHRRTRMLSHDWNSIPADPSPTPRIVHFPGMPLDDRRCGLGTALTDLGLD